MNLWELVDRAAHRPDIRVPAWALGCFRRRSITFFDGTIDTATQVLWLQSWGLTADFRWSSGAPRLPDRESLFACSPDELARLLKIEAGVARTAWDGALMSWHDWVGFQARVTWPEGGALRRVGDCLIEFAPSGAYVEDWRLEPPGQGPLVGLELIEERDGQGTIRHRGGALVVCGRHAAFVRGRPPGLDAELTLGELSATDSCNRANLEAWFACEASYGAGGPAEGGFVVATSTSPWRIGEALLSIDGFEYDRHRALVVQRTMEQGCPVERRFAVDTLEAVFDAGLATAVTPEGRAWFDREAPTLLRHAVRLTSR